MVGLVELDVVVARCAQLGQGIILESQQFLTSFRLIYEILHRNFALNCNWHRQHRSSTKTILGREAVRLITLLATVKTY